MNYEELALFIVTYQRSWPLKTNNFDTANDRSYARRITNITFSDADASQLTFNETGETITFLGTSLDVGTVIMCGRVNHQWFAIRPAQIGVVKQVILKRIQTTLATEDYTYNSVSYEDFTSGVVDPNGPDYTPETMELITTGDYKNELDGLYQVIPKFNGIKERRSHVNFYCVGTDLIRKAGASMDLVQEGYWTGSEIRTKYTLTVSHSNITTTTYEGTTALLSKTGGDSTLPDDIYIRFNTACNMPLWFDLASDDTDITGMYTLWPRYYNETAGSWSATSKSFIHAADGTRQTVSYSGSYVNSTTDYFRISITVPSGGLIRFKCDLPDWSNENGTKITFDLESNTSSSSAPDTIEVRRPQTGYTRTIKEEDQL